MSESAFSFSPWTTRDSYGDDTHGRHEQWQFRHEPGNLALPEHRRHHRHHHHCQCGGSCCSPDPASDFDYRPVDTVTAHSRHRPQTGRWVRTGNSITLFDVTDAAWDPSRAERDEWLDESLNEFETPPPPGVAIPGTTHRLDCPGGCAPLPAAQCVPVIHQAISEAINMALGAANKLDASLKPGRRTPDANNTARLFQFFFGHDPTRPVAWAGGMPSGASIAGRYRAVARELGGGRRIVFRCGDAAFCSGAVAVTQHCAGADAKPNVINLCGPFWGPPALPGLPAENFQAATILHEMLHVIFCEGFHDGGPPPDQFRRNNASCLEAFACRVNGFGADPSAVTLCANRPV
jgi:hypothetical protein